MKKTLSIIMAALMLFAMASFAFAADETISLKVDVEGITKTLFNDTVTVDKDASCLDALKATKVEVVSTESEYGAYIVSIGGDAAGKFGGWDGWLFMLDGKEISASADLVKVGEAKEMTVYYGDPYGIGMQYPEADEHISEGYITFTSADTVTDWETYESTTTVNPVADATVTFSNGTVLKTDKDGKIDLTKDLKKAGSYTYTVEKYSDKGCPLVLRTTGEYSISFFEMIRNWFISLFAKIAALFNR